MALTYDEFKKIAPKETLDFFSVLLPLLNRYLSHGSDLYFNGTNYSKTDLSNGNIYINGGTINITANSAFDYDGTAEKKCGTIIVNKLRKNNTLPPLNFK